MMPDNKTNFIEVTVLAAVRYFLPRSSIVAVDYPNDLVMYVLPRMTDAQKKMLLTEINNFIDDAHFYDGVPSSYKHWLKLRSYLYADSFITVVTNKDELVECFTHDGKLIPVEMYLQNPGLDVYISANSIKEYKKN